MFIKLIGCILMFPFVSLVLYGLMISEKAQVFMVAVIISLLFYVGLKLITYKDVQDRIPK